jgi:hypothetical protein
VATALPLIESLDLAARIWGGLKYVRVNHQELSRRWNFTGTERH